jgi:hypothetical protein
MLVLLAHDYMKYRTHCQMKKEEEERRKFRDARSGGECCDPEKGWIVRCIDEEVCMSSAGSHAAFEQVLRHEPIGLICVVGFLGRGSSCLCKYRFERCWC